MSEVIPLHGDAHLKTQMALPWYVNGSLEDPERAAVEAHLAGCAECRAELASERGLAQAIGALPAEGDAGFSRLRARIEAGARPPQASAPQASAPQSAPAQSSRSQPRRSAAERPGRRPLLGRRVALGWAVAAQAAVVLLGVGILSATLRSRPAPAPAGAYHVLGAAPSAVSGDILVMFQPTSTEAELQADLTRSGARVVDGPTASGAFVLQAPAAGRDKALASLKSGGHVLLAEPIDGDLRP